MNKVEKYWEWVEAKYRYHRDTVIVITAIVLLAIGCIML